jgi:hypothetical protein
MMGPTSRHHPVRRCGFWNSTEASAIEASKIRTSAKWRQVPKPKEEWGALGEYDSSHEPAGLRMTDEACRGCDQQPRNSETFASFRLCAHDVLHAKQHHPSLLVPFAKRSGTRSC